MMRALMWISVALGMLLALASVSQPAILGGQIATLAVFCVLLAIFMSLREPAKRRMTAGASSTIHSSRGCV